MKGKHETSESNYANKMCTIQTKRTSRPSIRQWIPNICLGNVGLFLTAVFILILELTK